MIAKINDGKKHYFRLPVNDWRDSKYFHGTYREYLRFLETGYYSCIKNSGTRYYDGYLSLDVMLTSAVGIINKDRPKYVYPYV